MKVKNPKVEISLFEDKDLQETWLKLKRRKLQLMEVIEKASHHLQKMGKTIQGFEKGIHFQITAKSKTQATLYKSKSITTLNY